MSNEEKKKPKLSEETYLNALVGKEVKLTFLDGEVMEAVYVASDRYQIFVKIDRQVFMIYKHALRLIVPADGGD